MGVAENNPLLAFIFCFPIVGHVIIGAVTHPTVKSTSHGKKSRGKFNVGLVYHGNMWVTPKLIDKVIQPLLRLHSGYCGNNRRRSWQYFMLC